MSGETGSEAASSGALNPALDRAALARNFAQSGRVQIHDFLTPSYAEKTHDVLRAHVPWSLVYNRGSENIELKPQELAALSAEERKGIGLEILNRARDGFQFRYHAFMIVPSYLANDYPGHPLYRLLEYINGEEFLGLIREVTGLPELVKADAQATLYAPGDFLTLHDDRGKPGAGWRLAYVMSFARDWRAEWGGLLQFFGGDERTVVETFVPRFNALNIFRVPAPHAVSLVSPFAPLGRYAVTGWFFDR